MSDELARPPIAFAHAGKEFKFRLGDVVCHKGFPHHPLVVEGRLLHECHGGIQREYRCTTFDHQRGLQVQDFNESGLLPYNEKASTDAVFKEWLQRFGAASPKSPKAETDKPE